MKLIKLLFEFKNIILIEKYFGEKSSKINFLKASYNDISKVSVAKCHPKSRFTDETTINNNRSLGRRRLVLKNLLIFVTSKVLKCSYWSDNDGLSEGLCQMFNDFLLWSSYKTFIWLGIWKRKNMCQIFFCSSKVLPKCFLIGNLLFL